MIRINHQVSIEESELVFSFIRSSGPGGKYHKIYMGDPRKADPAKLKTILRHPVNK
jgi:hypothetical protein